MDTKAQKKALALAVAGALGAPALALAQTSTVQIYGNVNVHYVLQDQGRGLKKIDGFAAQDTYMGFRGEEKLGGGLSAWFQCENTLDITGEDTTENGFCTRNSGVGFKGGFGNVWFGIWDTPYKITHGSVYRPFSTTGPYGNSSLLHNSSTGHSANGLLGAPLGTSGAAGAASSFSRRQINAINYQSPRWSGFQVLAQYSATDESTPLTNGAAPTTKPRLYSMGANYTAGPIYVGMAYEAHKAYNPGLQPFGFGAGSYTGNGEDKAWQVVAAYTFGPVRVGASYHDKKYEVADPAIAGALRDIKNKGWALYGDWRIAGPHSLRLGYIQTQDVKGNGTVNVNNLQAPVLAATGAAISDTGAKLYAIQYAYAFSKRTVVGFGYAKLDNERNSRHMMQSLTTRNTCQGVAGTGTVPPAAASCNRDQDAWALSVTHRF